MSVSAGLSHSPTHAQDLRPLYAAADAYADPAYAQPAAAAVTDATAPTITASAA